MVVRLDNPPREDKRELRCEIGPATLPKKRSTNRLERSQFARIKSYDDSIENTPEMSASEPVLRKCPSM